jgi:hypothetical protein
VLLALARREPVLAAFIALYLSGFIVYGIVVGSAATPVYVVEIVGGAIVYTETNVGGYMNTGWDLVANLVGASAAAVWLGLRGRAKGALGPS